MAPLPLHPHSCEHCEQLVIDETAKREEKDQESTNEVDMYTFFNFTYQNIIEGAADDCSLCKWLLETEWIHRSATVDEYYNVSGKNIKPGYEKVLDALAESSIRHDYYLPAPNPENILSKYYTGNGNDDMDNLRLVCTFREHMDIQLFGLWDMDKGHLVYRTRHGFSIFAVPGNPAARTISTRPIEKEVGSDAILAKVSVWLHECLHGEIRGKKLHASCPKPMDDYLPTRLIEITKIRDVFELKVKLMKGSSAEPYCALSYCWGGEQSVKLTQASLPRCMENIPWDDLPQALRDAVTVCQKLNIKYLWVDAFCIVQDDPDEKAFEISHMPDVYYNSTLTIAASRTNNVRESFLEDRSEEQFMNEVFTLKYHAKRVADTGSVALIRAQIKPEPLDTRGWTLQERLLSARTLEFGSRQLRFICQHNPRGVTDGWRLKPESNKFRQDNLENIEVLQAVFDTQSKYPQVNDYYDVMETWYRLVGVYSHRNLTLPEDRILAISGIAERYGRFLNDSYLAGLWRSTLSRSLFWQATDNTLPRPTAWQGPSWSWVSLSSPVDFPSSTPLDAVEPQIVAIDLDLANSAHSYGAVLEGSGRLVVKAKQLKAVLFFSTAEFGRTKVSAASLMMNDTPDLFQIGISVDSLEEAREAEKENDAWLLELSSVCTDELWATRGLVVRSYGEDSFTRMGTFEYKTDGSVRRQKQKEESAEEWRLRVNREYNWFGRVKTEIYDIL